MRGPVEKVTAASHLSHRNLIIQGETTRDRLSGNPWEISGFNLSEMERGEEEKEEMRREVNVRDEPER